MIDFLEALNQITDFVSSSWSARSGTEMGAAAEWSALIDLALTVVRVEKRATSIFRNHDFFSASGFPRAGGDERLTFRKIGRVANQTKAATIGDASALAIYRPPLPLGVDLADLADCGVEIRLGGHVMLVRHDVEQLAGDKDDFADGFAVDVFFDFRAGESCGFGGVFVGVHREHHAVP